MNQTATAYKNRAGFTLIELSLVLVIIGLVVGGVLVGRDLIKAAETRSAVSLITQIETAALTFRTKYNCIIGDCPNATEIFGDYANYTTCNAMTNGVGNGNGNGIIDYGGAAWWQCENVMAIKTLALSGLLPASIVSPCWNSVVIFNGINDRCGYFYNDDLYNQVTARKANTLNFSDLATSGSLAAPAISPTGTRQIDEKIDDGVPTSGKFRGLDTAAKSGGAIIANSCSTAGVYNNSDTISCRILYYLK
ncbi:MAG: prepilin-type N-terminal cleavage/methylation domain-containing protein [Pseudomonadota bacterium]